MENPEATHSHVAKTEKNLFWFYLAGGLILLAGAFLLIIQVGGGAPEITPTKSLSGSSAAGSYSQKDFSLSYPSGWKALSPTELSEPENFFAFAIRHDSPGALVTVKVEERATGKIQSDQLAAAITERINKEFAELHMLNSQITKNKAGQEILKYDYAFTSGPGSTMRQQLYVILSESKAYYVAAQAAPADFEKIESDVDKIIGGFSAK